jgi:hypothetical protein
VRGSWEGMKFPNKRQSAPARVQASPEQVSVSYGSAVGSTPRLQQYAYWMTRGRSHPAELRHMDSSTQRGRVETMGVGARVGKAGSARGVQRLAQCFAAITPEGGPAWISGPLPAAVLSGTKSPPANPSPFGSADRWVCDPLF